MNVNKLRAQIAAHDTVTQNTTRCQKRRRWRSVKRHKTMSKPRGLYIYLDAIAQ